MLQQILNLINNSTMIIVGVLCGLCLILFIILLYLLYSFKYKYKIVTFDNDIDKYKMLFYIFNNNFTLKKNSNLSLELIKITEEHYLLNRLNSTEFNYHDSDLDKKFNLLRDNFLNKYPIINLNGKNAVNNITDEAILELLIDKKNKIIDLFSGDINNTELKNSLIFEIILFFFLISDYLDVVNNKDWASNHSKLNIENILNPLALKTTESIDTYNGVDNPMKFNVKVINAYKLINSIGNIENINQLILGYKFK